MKCEHYQRWISDDLDGALAAKKRRKLESHLGACSACRSYRQALALIQAEGGALEARPVASDYFEEFTAAIETKLRQEKQAAGRVGSVAPRWKWAWVSAPLALALVLGIIFFRSGGAGVRNEVFSFEACLDSVFEEIGGDEEIAADFNRFLSVSLLDGGEAVVLEDDIDLWNEPFFWRSLSDEDLRWIEEGIKKGIRS
jgi:anti-sigma factor RsiW